MLRVFVQPVETPSTMFDTNERTKPCWQFASLDSLIRDTLITLSTIARVTRLGIVLSSSPFGPYVCEERGRRRRCVRFRERAGACIIHRQKKETSQVAPRCYISGRQQHKLSASRLTFTLMVFPSIVTCTLSGNFTGCFPILLS